MILWPGQLPQQLLVEGYQEQEGDGLLRTPMDAGPAKVRRRVTAVPRPLSGEIIVTPAQLNFFKYWYNNVIFGGSLRFGWVDPWSDTVLTNLITNGGFDSNTDGWTPSDAALASIPGGVYGNCLQITPTAVENSYALQDISLTVGKTYNFEAYIHEGSAIGATYYAGIYDNTNGVWVDLNSGIIPSEWTHGKFEIIAPDTALRVLIGKQYDAGIPGTMLFDEVSLVDITSGIVEMRFTEPPAWSAIDSMNIRISMNLEILP